MNADVVDRHDVRMVQGAGGLRLVGEPLSSCRIGPGPREHFDRDIALQPWIASAIHVTHTARAQEADDVVGTETGGRLR
jgi:hypothetical protein